MSSKPIHVNAQDGLRALRVKLHTREKLHYLRRYIDQFCIGTKKWQVRNYIDLFTGPGVNVYEGGEGEDKSAAFEACSHKHPFTQYFLNDIDSESTNSLRSRISALKLDKKVQITLRSDDCNRVVGEFVDVVKRKPSVNLAILDGFGIECHWASVEMLASVQRMDMVILFPGNMTVVRNAERWSQEDDAQLDLFMPSKDWRKVWTDRRQGGNSATANLLNMYVAGLRRLNYASEDAVRTQLIKSESGQHLYHLIFASRNPLGSKFWKQATGRDDEGQMSLPF
jgi:three-Cys-motif partner protein